MRSGLLDEIITVQKQYIVINDYGEQELTYHDHCTVKARQRHNRGARDIENDEILHNYLKTFEVWKFVDVEDTDFIKWNGKQYRILSIEYDSKQQKKIIETELVND